MDIKKVVPRALAAIKTVYDAIDLSFSLMCFKVLSWGHYIAQPSQPVWLFCERGVDARDNAAALFEYVCKHRPEIYAVYVITPSEHNARDHARVSAAGETVQRGSWRHKVLFFYSSVLVSAHFRGYVEPWRERVMKFLYKNYSSKKFVFIQHGIIKDDMSELLHKNITHYDLFTTSATREHEYLKKSLSYTEPVLRSTGMARYDLLPRTHTKTKTLLIMPTWRSYVTEGVDGTRAKLINNNGFETTDYYKHYHELLTSEDLLAMLDHYNYRCTFYLHFEMERYAHYFSNCDRIEFATSRTHDIHQLLTSSDLLITDYSSIFFDFAYMKKPLIYFQFDQEDFFKKHYRHGYFNYATMGFGPVVTTQKDLLSEITLSFQSDCELASLYRNRSESFFAYTDRKNCQRITEAILTL